MTLMALKAILSLLVAFCIQYFFPAFRWDSSAFFEGYQAKLMPRLGIASAQPWSVFCFMLFPLWILVLMVWGIIYWISPAVAFLVECGMAWLCLDLYPAQLTGRVNAVWLEEKMHSVYSPIFWFAFSGFGFPALILIYLARSFGRLNPVGSLVGGHDSPTPTAKVLDYLAWIPTRLLLLVWGVVGDFSAMMAAAKPVWLLGVPQDYDALHACQRASLRQSPTDLVDSNDQDIYLVQYRLSLYALITVYAIYVIGQIVA